MDERRATHLGAGYGLLSETELEVVPIIAKCLEGMKVAAWILVKDVKPLVVYDVEC